MALSFFFSFSLALCSLNQRPPPWGEEKEEKEDGEKKKLRDNELRRAPLPPSLRPKTRKEWE